jgi:hypothetical protein
MPSNLCHAEIFDALLALGERFEFAGELAFIKPVKGACRSPADPPQALAVLVEKFGESALIEAGVAVRSHAGLLQFSPALARPGTPFVVLYGDADNQPYCLVTSAGCLGHDSPPLFAALEDRHTTVCRRKSENGCIYVCATIDDVILLRSLGLAATIVTGLTEPNWKVFQVLGRQFSDGLSDQYDDEESDNIGTVAGVQPPRDVPELNWNDISEEDIEAEALSPDTAGEDDEDDEDEFGLDELSITFVAWSPSRLELGMPSCIADAEKYCRDLDANFEMFLRMGTWLPTEADLALLKFAIALKTTKLLKKKMLLSFRNSCYSPLKGKLPRAPSLPVDYGDAVGRLLGPAADDKAMIPSPDKPHALWQCAQQLLERDVVQPIVNQALRTPDRIEGTLTLGLAELSRIFHTQGLLLGKKLSQAVATKGADGLAEVPSDGIKQFLALAGRMQSMAGEIYRRRESSIAGAIECRVISPPSSPRSLGSH